MNYLWLIGLGWVCAGVAIWFAYNRLAALDSRCDRAFADIDVQLKHRHGLLPNLVETVRGFAKQELEILDKVTAARGSALNARTPQAQMVAEADLSTGIAQLLTVVEFLIRSCNPRRISSDCAWKSPTRRTRSPPRVVSSTPRWTNTTLL